MAELKSAPNYSVPALEKGLAALELLARAAEPLSLSQISEMMANSASQLFRTMNCLVESGYVIKDDAHGTYSLTLKLFELANRHSPLKHLLRVAILPMQELARAIRESCHISIIQHGQLLVVGQAESPEKVQISVSVGTSFPLVSTVSGRLLLSVMDEGSLNAILEEDDGYRRMAAEERVLFRARIAKIRSSGVSTAVDESYIGLHDTAVLVGNPEVGVTAAIAVTQLTASRQRKDPQEVVHALLRCAGEINARAGLTHFAGQPA
ncbi:MAG: helix-turn-helix domain-containing protein [Chloroflexota bacterium]|nr:helix-turn-helix domain-containing protein [Chloroflexota bacterium]MDE2909198.1 helix-turn-helix domain-containing protein [Chloroflexota bacterium]